MSWVKLDDGFPEHEKVEDLSDAAFRLAISAMCRTARRGTDGQVTRKDLRVLLAQMQREDQAIELPSELVKADLWIPCDEGWTIKNWLRWNPPAAKVQQDREAAKERMQEGRRRSRERSPERSGERSPSGRSPSPSRPVPSREEHSNECSNPPLPPAEVPAPLVWSAEFERARKDLVGVRQHAGRNWGAPQGTTSFGLHLDQEQKLVRDWLHGGYSVEDAVALGECIALGNEGPFKGMSCVAKWLVKNLAEAVQRARDFKARPVGQRANHASGLNRPLVSSETQKAREKL